MPDNRDKSTDKDSDASSLFEKMFSRFQFFFIQQKIFSEFSDERFTSIISDSIRQQRSDDTSYGTNNNDSLKGEMFCRYQKSCERHNCLAWYRENHTFQYHSHKDSDISGLFYESRDIGRKEFGDSHTKRINKIKIFFLSSFLKGGVPSRFAG